VVGGDQTSTARRAQRSHDPAETGIDMLDGLDGPGEIAGVADHVGVGEVDDEDIGFARFDGAQNFVREFEGRHLRREIISRHFRRGDQQPFSCGYSRSVPPLKK
jgi:hypothetical protein